MFKECELPISFKALSLGYDTFSHFQITYRTHQIIRQLNQIPPLEPGVTLN